MRVFSFVLYVTLSLNSFSAQAGWFDFYTEPPKKQAAEASDEKLISSLNFAPWTWLVFQATRNAFIEETKKRINSGSDSNQKIAQAICTEVLKDNMINGTIRELFSQSMKQLKQQQVSEKTFLTCFKAEVYLREIADILANANPDASWSPDSILSWLTSSAANREMTVIRYSSRADILANFSIQNMLALSLMLINDGSSAAISARSALLTNAIAKDKQAVLNHSGWIIRNAANSYPSTMLEHVSTDIAIIKKYGDEKTLIALTQHLIEILEALKKKNSPRAASFAREVVQSIYSSGGGSGGGSSRGGGGGGGYGGSADAHFASTMAEGYASGEFNSETIRNYLQRLAAQRALDNVILQISSSILSICDRATEKNDKEILVVCANDLVAMLSNQFFKQEKYREKQLLLELISTLFNRFGSETREDSFKRSCTLVDYTDKVIKAEATAKHLIGKTLAVSNYRDKFNITFKSCKSRDEMKGLVVPGEGNFYRGGKRGDGPVLGDSVSFCVNFLGESEYKNDFYPRFQDLRASPEQYYLDRMRRFTTTHRYNSEANTFSDLRGNEVMKALDELLNGNQVRVVETSKNAYTVGLDNGNAVPALCGPDFAKKLNKKHIIKIWMNVEESDQGPACQDICNN